MYSKNCPSCNKIQNFKTKGALKTALKSNSKCKACSTKINSKNSIINGTHPFLTYRNSKEQIEKIKQTKIKNSSYEKYKTQEFKQKMSEVTSGNKNPMYGKNYYDIWIIKYGKEEADRRAEIKRINNSKSASGQNNPMYGKSTPKKAGNGWQGWYNNQFFRSLRELSYIINVLEKEGLEWKSAEKIRIPYINYDGNERTYSPDFLVDNKYLIEIKPTKLHNTTLIKLKTEAAIKYCNENGLKFKIVDQDIIEIKELQYLIDLDKVKLTEKTKEKFLSYSSNSVSIT